MNMFRNNGCYYDDCFVGEQSLSQVDIAAQTTFSTDECGIRWFLCVCERPNTVRIQLAAEVREHPQRKSVPEVSQKRL